jgi:UDP-3-O-[3-hydroxymyristoyl] glucosamine N-acyltransferase
MKLSDLVDKIKDIRLYKDGEFDYLDFSNSKLNSKVLTFIEDERYIKNISNSITCIICKNENAKLLSGKYGILLSENPRLDFYLIHNFLSLNFKESNKKNFKTKIGKSCKISNKAIIGEKNTIIGNNVIIEDNTVIKNNVNIGNNCIIRSGSIIGGEGFQFNKGKKRFFIEHCGGVTIGDNVEIQYNSCIDRALFLWDKTKVGDETKIDNLVHVEHAVKIGSNCLIAGNSCIGGSTTIGNNCWIGLSATISNGLVIGNNCRINIGAVVTKNINDNQSVSGNFAIEHSKFIDFIKKIR